MKHNKRAFTIVELVIVIAILAILAAVLIPTFVNLTKKANESNTMQLVKNMNTALKADMPDGKHPTMQSALDAANAFGYDLEKINKSKTDNEILWDSANDCFVYMKDGEAQYVPDSNLTVSKEEMKNQPYMYWTISSTVNTKYSTYLYDYTGDSNITVSTGIDVGNVTTITKITYTSNVNEARDIVIRTNGATALEVNGYVDASNTKLGDVIAHYGEAGSVDIVKCAMASFHEYGKVMLIQLKQGHVVAENGSVVSQISIPEGIDVSAIKVKVEADADVAAVTATIDISGVVDVKNNNTAVVNKANNKYTAFIGTTGYNSLGEAISSAKSGQKIILMNNCTETSFSTTLAGKELTIDLNGCTMQFNSFNLDVVKGTQDTVESLTFVDSGAVKGKMVCKGNIAVSMGPNDTVVLDGVNLECTIYGLFPRGEAAKLEVKNSKVSAPVYAIATNAAKTENGGVVISIDNSIIETVSSDQDNTAVQINVESNTTIKNSTLKGQRQALMIRGGTAVIENSTIEKTGTKESSAYTDYSDETKTWGSGNAVPAYALVLGNRSSAYQYVTNVTLKNVTIKGGIYSWGNSTPGLEANVTFVGTNYGTIVKGENVKVTGDITEN